MICLQVRAVLCEDSIRSSTVYRKFVVLEGPTVFANLSIGGTVPVVDVKVVTAAIADSINIPPAIVRFVSTVHLDKSRRLLTAVMSFNILATDADDAVLLQQKILKANMQVKKHDFDLVYKAY